MRTQLRIDSSEWPEIWQATCRILESAIPHAQLVAWIYPLKFVSSETQGEGLVVELAAQHEFSVSWVRDHHQGVIETALAQVTGSPCKIELSLSDGSSGEAPYESPLSTPASEIAEPRSTNSAESYAEEAALQAHEVDRAPELRPSGVLHATPRHLAPVMDQPDPRYLFSNFVVGASNQFAHASAVAVAEQPGRQYNPLFLYSPPGLGKTHLLHAIGNHVMARNPQARVAYLSAERFVNELVESIQHGKMPLFRKKYRDSFDLILIDDIHFIAGKTSSEEEFFHTFNVLYSSKRQIVLTSDRPPKEIEGLEERIRTRFEWGLTADITPPEIETRIAILKTKAERDDIYLPDEVATFLATHIKGNVRELEGILIRLQAHASLTGVEISLDMAKQELRTAVPEEGAQVTVEAIQSAILKHYQIKMADLKGNSRVRKVALPRQIAMYLVRKYTPVGLKEIGSYFGGRDHATVSHAIHKIENDIESEPELREAVEAVQNLL